MTGLAQLVAELASYGARIVVRDGKPRLIQKARRPPERLVASIREHRRELICPCDQAPDPRIPDIYASALTQLQVGLPADVLLPRWRRFITDARAFLATWGRQAEALDWTASDLFGLDPVAPMARYDGMGLIWFLKGERVVALTTTEARFSGGLAFRRRP
jgi:hypothetical protein